MKPWVRIATAERKRLQRLQPRIDIVVAVYSTLLFCAPISCRKASHSISPDDVGRDAVTWSPDEVKSEGTETEAAVHEWVMRRVANARRGLHEIVEFPVVFHGGTWSCSCPLNYISVSMARNPESLRRQWVRLEFAAGVAVPEYEAGHGTVLWARGFFTGSEDRVTETFAHPKLHKNILPDAYVVYDVHVLAIDNRAHDGVARVVSVARTEASD